ncbi:MAG: folate/biopterin family MFS transporter [Gammaproteobacteria bacterium]|nr:folate/biopterin family MFS transporter [Gammaproteobacteria bacterium]
MEYGLGIFYFCLGIQLQLPELAIRYYLIDQGIDVASLAAFQATLAIPWCMKPLYGFLSDSCKLCSLRRKPYIILCNFLGSFCWVSMYSLRPTVMGAQGIIVITSILTCFADVMYDSILVEMAKKELINDHGKVQSFCWGCRAFGALLAAGISGYLLMYLTALEMFLIEGGIFLLVSGLGYTLICEMPKMDESKRCCTQLRVLWNSIRQPELWRPAVFVFIFAATPSSYTAFFYFLVNELKFSSEFLGLLTCIRHASMIMGTYIYSKCFRNVQYRRYFLVLVIISAVLGASPVILVTHMNTQMGLPNSIFAIGDDLFLSVVGQIALMPCLVLAAKLCPTGVEASLYAGFVSILNFAGIISEYGGAVLTHLLGVHKTNFDQLSTLIIICTLSSLLPLCFLRYLPKGNVQEIVADHANKVNLEDVEEEMIPRVSSPQNVSSDTSKSTFLKNADEEMEEIEIELTDI